MTIILILVSSLITVISLSQNMVPGSQALLDKLRLNDGIKGIQNLMYSDIAGNPFIFRDFHKATLIIGNNERFDVNVRYDIYADEMHLKDGNQVFAIIHPEKIKMIETDSIQFIHAWYSKSSGSGKPDGDSYFIVKRAGKCMLLIRKNIRLQEPEPPKILQDAKPAKFVHQNDTYYFKLEDQNAVQVKNKKDMLSVLNDKKADIEKYLNSNNPDLKKIEDLFGLVDFYNNQ